MKYLKYLTISLLLAISMFGCMSVDTSRTALSVLNTIAGITYYYDNGGVVNFVGQAKLSDSQISQVVAALDLVTETRTRLQKYKDDPLLLTSNISQINLDYVKIRYAYLTIRSIAISHQSEYSPEAWQVMISFDDLAGKLDTEFYDLVSAAKANEALTNAVAMTSAVLKIAAVM